MGGSRAEDWGLKLAAAKTTGEAKGARGWTQRRVESISLRC